MSTSTSSAALREDTSGPLFWPVRNPLGGLEGAISGDSIYPAVEELDHP